MHSASFFFGNALGPVVYDADKCMGCRYCMQACPFQVPSYEWNSRLPKMRKCDMCYERQLHGKPTACTEACPVGATIDGSHIAYSADINYAGILIALYVVATCGSCLVASNRWLVLLGLANLGAVIALGWITFTGFTSLWCAWAALASVAIAVYLRRSARASSSSGLVLQGQ